MINIFFTGRYIHKILFRSKFKNSLFLFRNILSKFFNPHSLYHIVTNNFQLFQSFKIIKIFIKINRFINYGYLYKSGSSPFKYFNFIKGRRRYFIKPIKGDKPKNLRHSDLTLKWI